MKLNHVSLKGNASRDPELRFTAGGTATCSFSIAYNTSTKDKNTGEWVDNPPQFFQVVCWSQLAENVAATVTKGMNVVVTGQLEQRSWEKDGEKHSMVQIKADDVMPSLERATATVEKVSRSGANSEYNQEETAPAPKARTKPKVVEGEGDDEDF